MQGDPEAGVTYELTAIAMVVIGGTSLAGQTVGPGLVVDTSRHLHRVREIDPEAGTALVDAGVVADDLNSAAAAYGLMFGPDTSTGNRATIGGMVGNNSAGSGSVRYGMTADHVLAPGETVRIHGGAGQDEHLRRYLDAVNPPLRNLAGQVVLRSYDAIVLDCVAWGSGRCPSYR